MTSSKVTICLPQYVLNPIVYVANFGLHAEYFCVPLTVVKAHSAELNNHGLLEFFFLP